MNTSNANMEFLKACDAAAKFILEHTENQKGMVRVFSHYDADGLTAGGILGRTLQRANITFHLTILSKLDVVSMDQIKKDQENWDLVIFSDLGSNKISTIIEEFNTNVVILDHHSTNETEVTPNSRIFHLNPHIFGIDGSSEVSGAGISYLVSKSIDKANLDLACYAIVGALGDRQDRGKDSTFFSLNELIQEDAINSKLLEVKNDFWIYGYQTRPLVSVLMRENFDMDIYGFLDKCKIPTISGKRKRVLADLTEEEKTNLISNLVSEMNIDPLKYFKPVYTLVEEESYSFLRDAKEFSSILNAAGRLDKPSIGVALVMGDRKKAKKKAEQVSQEYRNLLKQHLDWSSQGDKIQNFTVVGLLDAREEISESLIGTISSILIANKSCRCKILIGIAKAEEGFVKISARVSKEVQQFIDIASIMKKVLKERSAEIEKEDYEVGGHDAAAGAVIETTFIQNFVKLVDDEAVVNLQNKGVLKFNDST